MSDTKKKLEEMMKELGVDDESSSDENYEILIGLLKKNISISKENNEMLRELLDSQHNKSYRPNNRNYYNGWQNGRGRY